MIVEGLEHPAFIEVCTIPESAVYLGKTQLTLKRWIRDRLLPPPILVCTTSGYKHYSMGELQLISKVLREHEKNYEYLHYTHDTTVQNLWQRIEGYRKSNI